jgi:hypothetical protein
MACKSVLASIILANLVRSLTTTHSDPTKSTQPCSVQRPPKTLHTGCLSHLHPFLLDHSNLFTIMVPANAPAQQPAVSNPSLPQHCLAHLQYPDYFSRPDPPYAIYTDSTSITPWYSSCPCSHGTYLWCPRTVSHPCRPSFASIPLLLYI